MSGPRLTTAAGILAATSLVLGLPACSSSSRSGGVFAGNNENGNASTSTGSASPPSPSPVSASPSIEGVDPATCQALAVHMAQLKYEGQPAGALPHPASETWTVSTAVLDGHHDYVNGAQAWLKLTSPGVQAVQCQASDAHTDQPTTALLFPAKPGVRDRLTAQIKTIYNEEEGGAFSNLAPAMVTGDGFLRITSTVVPDPENVDFLTTFTHASHSYVVLYADPIDTGDGDHPNNGVPNPDAQQGK
ncbi:MAG: hypothetical protein J2P17_14320 [Mycobacterium sp.]|nr:hypothetical protein [Mycobacterium sp.]